MPDGIQERDVSDKLKVRWGFDDGRVEIVYRASRWVPMPLTFTIEAKDLLIIPEIFEAARSHAAKIKGVRP